MSNEQYEILHIDETYSVPRALILVLHNGRPSSVYQVDCFGYELPPYDGRLVEATQPSNTEGDKNDQSTTT